MARVVLVTGRRFRHLWMIELACRALGNAVVGGVVQAAIPPETPGTDRWGKLKRSAKRTMRRAGIQTPVYLDLDPAEQCLWTQHGEPETDWQSWCSGNTLITAEPNSEEATAWLQQIAPDLVVVFGGKILAPAWFEQPHLGAINLHYGITPDYRGAESIVWAAYHRNWPGIGATIHYLDAGIETGPIIRHVPIAVETGDHLDSLTAKVYWRGMNELIELAHESVQQQQKLPASPTQPNRKQFYPSRRCTYEIRQVADQHVRQRAAVGANLHWQHYDTIDAERELPALRSWSESLTRQPAAKDRLPAGVYIFLYRDLSPEHERSWSACNEISTTPYHFREHLRYLTDLGRWVSPDEAYTQLARNQVDEPLLVLTFDDGFSSVHQYGQSIVSTLGIQPLLFLNGAAIAGEYAHYQVLAAILLTEGHGESLLAAINENAPARLNRQPLNVAELGQWLKQNHHPQWTDQLVTASYLKHHSTLPTSLYLSHEQIDDLLDEGWLLGNHSWSHTRLSCLSPDQVAQELERNEQFLANLAGVRPTWISYPYGVWDDVGPGAIEWVENDPSRIGVMADGGINLTLERAALRRIPVGDRDLTSFRQQIQESILASQRDQFRIMLGSV